MMEFCCPDGCMRQSEFNLNEVVDRGSWGEGGHEPNPFIELFPAVKCIQYGNKWEPYHVATGVRKDGLQKASKIESFQDSKLKGKVDEQQRLLEGKKTGTLAPTSDRLSLVMA